VSGYLAIDLLLRYLRRNSTYLFVWYRIGLGLLLLVLLAAGILKPLG
jgi:undecaprenyl-diphosphatase